jgi:hypothetical protein
MTKHRLGGPAAQQLDVIDAVPARDERVHQCQQLAARAGPTRPVTKIDQLVGDLLDPQPFGQGCGQQQPGRGDRPLVVEGEVDLVQHDMGGWHRKGVLRLGDRDRLAAVILPSQGTLSQSAHHQLGGPGLRPQARLEEGTRHFEAWESGLANLLASIGASAAPPTSTAGTNPGSSDTSQPTVATSTTPQAPTELVSTASASASSTAPDSVDDAGNPVSYEAANVLDDNTSTAWRVAGDGRGVTVTLTLPATAHLTKVGLVPGYAKIDPTTG